MKNKAFEKLVLKSLNKGKYKHCETCKRDVFDVLRAYKGLAPQFDSFVFDNGDERAMLNVNGTIPITYKGSTYNIPVCFWFPIDYPQSAPLAFVKPTLDMQIKASCSVDITGRILLPYLAEWKSPESTLVDLVQICILVFGQSPPVFSKARQHLAHQVSFSSSFSSRQSSVQEQFQGQAKEESEELISDEQLRLSLLSAAEELIRDKLEEEFMKTKAEVQSLHSTNKELLDGQEKINEILLDLETKVVELDSHATNVVEKHDALLATINELSEMDLGALDVDQVVVVQNPLHNQILDAFAMDSAIDDTIYTLGNALHQGHLDCEVYLKKVRNLSRKQFLQRVIINKCKQKSGLERSLSASSNA